MAMTGLLLGMRCVDCGERARGDASGMGITATKSGKAISGSYFRNELSTEKIF